MKLRYVTTGYLKKVKAKLPEGVDVDAFEKRIGKYVKEVVLPNFSEWEFYIGESSDPDGMVALLNYR